MYQPTNNRPFQATVPGGYAVDLSANSPASLLVSALPELFSTVTRSQRMTRADLNLFVACLMKPSLTDEQRRAVERVFYGLRRGRVRLVWDDLDGIDG